MKQGNSLSLQRCPHCNVAKPHLQAIRNDSTLDDKGVNPRYWSTYKCSICGGVVLAVAPFYDKHDPTAFDITDIWPAPQIVHPSIPERAKRYLEQAIASIHAPAGAVMLTASAVDAMLKEKGLKDGSLYSRIEAAATHHLITPEMASWAHEIRLDANDQRHSDEDASMPSEAEASKAVEFATALAQFLFVLPARVARGRAND
ncbi:DUF4145 domain-containing protein [Pseudomonas syringae]|uniref:Adenylosuccinate synthase n=1 Tax=Pseudomonas syringae pv. actinidiae TaxID=103796 RepID=A0A2V0Q6I7_PSESF|nr:DUF4145 domain-containing protein [Pseudomonas syringae]AQL36417.1 hypothetical protein JN853_08140 [Pseudomonas syringae pv. actinidiae ICMP 9853]EPM63467.1 hypothetical protein A256_01468 [Pseudomonas syringae pv. actinidiae ICMP 19103]EPM90407.1 hypothetical protein A260_01337 [Pseudomonas syringae pv. actinidiae ICMP 19068]EPM92535.1 hypothetical protein A259_35798 [Pseudomonas syringae pv. actinidiae ICMP 19070]EPM99274.1 hypothetical protein A258_01453 [Pseudomonas syringae pv. actini